MRLPSWLRRLIPEPARSETAGMDRRAFLRLAGQGALGAVVASTVDVEQLLWTPGEKTILIPDLTEQWDVKHLDPWRPHRNTFVSIDWLVQEHLRQLERSLAFAKVVNREYDRVYPRSGAKVGDRIRVAVR